MPFLKGARFSDGSIKLLEKAVGENFNECEVFISGEFELPDEVVRIQLDIGQLAPELTSTPTHKKLVGELLHLISRVIEEKAKICYIVVGGKKAQKSDLNKHWPFH